MATPIIAKIKSMIPLDISTLSSNDKRITCENIQVNENDKAELISSRNAKSAIFPPMDNLDDSLENKEKYSTDNYDPNRVF